MSIGAQKGMDIAPARSGPLASLQRIRALAWRYGTSAIGPVSVSAGHFIASLIFLHTLSPADFGAFSFLLVIVPFCMSIAGSLVGAPISNALSRTGDIDPVKLAAYRKLSLWLAVMAFVAVSILLRYSEGHWDVALMLGLYGAVMALRWCARCFAYASNRSFNATASDLLYSVLLVSSLLLLSFTHELFASSAALVLFVAAAIALLAYGRTYLREQWNAWHEGDLSQYLETWRELSRWSLMGVVLTEATANAHAYFVTFVSGTASFALLALGALMMRPLSLVLSSLTDRERPAIARLIAGDDKTGVKRGITEFSVAGIAMWVLTLALAGAIFIWFPELLLEKGYDVAHLLPVVAIWAGIWAARTLWTPQSILLQAQGEYSSLARASIWSSIVSLSATLILLLTAGPVVSLLGVLAGDLVLALHIFALTRPWRLSHA